MGLLYYAAAASETLGDALRDIERYISIVNAGINLKCIEAGNLTIMLRYSGVSRHSDRQQMEFLVTALIRMCRVLTGHHVKPISVHLLHRRIGKLIEFKKFLGCRIAFGAESDEIVFDKRVVQLHLVGADPYLDKMS